MVLDTDGGRRERAAHLSGISSRTAQNTTTDILFLGLAQSAVTSRPGPRLPMARVDAIDRPSNKERRGSGCNGDAETRFKEKTTRPGGFTRPVPVSDGLRAQRGGSCLCAGLCSGGEAALPVQGRRKAPQAPGVVCGPGDGWRAAGSDVLREPVLSEGPQAAPG